MDEEEGNNEDSIIPNTLPKYLHFIAEEQVSVINNAAGIKNTDKSKKETYGKESWPDEISHEPTTENVKRKQHGYSSRKPHTQMERKLSGGISSLSHEDLHNMSKGRHSHQEKYLPGYDKNNYQRHNRHRRGRHK